MKILLIIAAYLVLSPIIGGLLAGLDRIITARMQGRVGPPILQSFYDVAKLLEKENLVVRRSQNFYIYFCSTLTVFTGALFFTGCDLLIFIFALTFADIFFVLAGFKASSPYSFIGAQRELIQMMSYEPAIILSAVGMYMVTGTFKVSKIISYDTPLAFYLPGLLICFMMVLVIKLRKSPFDLSTSHHGHQEVVKGITTEFSGRTLAMIEITHWYENVFTLGFMCLFFSHNILAGILITLVMYFIAIIIDNSFARAKWQSALAFFWITALVLGFGNIMMLYIFSR